jgi:hypothetical protein
LRWSVAIPQCGSSLASHNTPLASAGESSSTILPCLRHSSRNKILPEDSPVRPLLGGRLSADDRHLGPDGAEQAALTAIRDLWAAGHSLRGIAATLNTHGHRTRRGTDWRLESVARVVKQTAASAPRLYDMRSRADCAPEECGRQPFAKAAPHLGSAGEQRGIARLAQVAEFCENATICPYLGL